MILLEARDRAGGPLSTDRTTMGVPSEREAELIHGSMAAARELIGDHRLMTRNFSTYGAVIPRKPVDFPKT